MLEIRHYEPPERRKEDLQGSERAARKAADANIANLTAALRRLRTDHTLGDPYHTLDDDYRLALADLASANAGEASIIEDAPQQEGQDGTGMLELFIPPPHRTPRPHLVPDSPRSDVPPAPILAWLASPSKHNSLLSNDNEQGFWILPISGCAGPVDSSSRPTWARYSRDASAIMWTPQRLTVLWDMLRVLCDSCTIAGLKAFALFAPHHDPDSKEMGDSIRVFSTAENALQVRTILDALTDEPEQDRGDHWLRGKRLLWCLANGRPVFIA